MEVVGRPSSGEGRVPGVEGALSVGVAWESLGFVAAEVVGYGSVEGLFFEGCEGVEDAVVVFDVVS